MQRPAELHIPVEEPLSGGNGVTRSSKRVAVRGAFRACPGMGYSPAALIQAWLDSPAELPAWLRFQEREVILTYQGRTALGLLCSLIRVGPGDHVLLPAYNCGAEVDPFVRTGCKVEFYRIDSEAKVDTNDILARMCSATKLIYITHFFGWPQEIEELASVCKQRNVLLVEDCAQALFSVGSSQRIGELGDAIIYSFVKFLALPDGGALALDRKLPARLKGMVSPQAAETFWASLPMFKKWFMQHSTVWQKSALARAFLGRSWLQKSVQQDVGGRREMLASNRFLEARRLWAMSRAARGILRQVDVGELVSRRRRNFARLHAGLQDQEYLSPLYRALPEHVSPLAYPVYAKDPIYARGYFEENGILVQGWPGYYPGMPWDDYPDACALKDNLITLPVHQDLSLEQMDYIAECANLLARN